MFFVLFIILLHVVTQSKSVIGTIRDKRCYSLGHGRPNLVRDSGVFEITEFEISKTSELDTVRANGVFDIAGRLLYQAIFCAISQDNC